MVSIHLERVLSSRYLPWRIDDVDGMVVPRSVSGRRCNRDTFFAFEFHAVHFRTDAILASDFVNFADSPRVEEDSFSKRRFPRVNMRTNPDIPLFYQGIHLFRRYLCCVRRIPISSDAE